MKAMPRQVSLEEIEEAARERLTRLDQDMFEQFLVPHATGIHLLDAPHDLSQVDSITPRAVIKAVRDTLLYFDANRDEIFVAAASEEDE